MTSAGTLERLALLLGDALGPLSKQLHDDPGALLARLGVAIDDAVLAPAVHAATQVAAAATDLTTATAALNVSINADQSLSITTNGAMVISKIAAVLDALGSFRASISTALSGLPAAQRNRANALLADLPQRVLSLLVVDTLKTKLPQWTAVLVLAGLIDLRNDPGVPTDRMFPAYPALAVRWDRLGRFVTDPLSLLRDAYGFGLPTFDGVVLLDLLVQLFDTGDPRDARPYVTTGASGARVLQAPSFVLAVEGGQLVFPQRLGLDGATDVTLPLADRSSAVFAVSGKIPTGSQLRLAPSLQVTISPPAGATANLNASATITAGVAGHPVTVLGFTGVGGISVETVSATMSLTAGWNGTAASGELGIGVSTAGTRLNIELAEVGALLSALLPQGTLGAAFDLGLDLAGGKVRLRGGAALTATFPVHASVGPVEVQSITVGLGIGGGGLPIELSTSLRTTLGPLDIVVDRIGVTLNVDAPSGGGNLGPLAIAPRLRPPSGLGISLDAGPAQGGGYLAVDPSGNRYAGVLQFKLSFIAVTGYGIYEQAPGGSPSFVAVIGVRFWPGIQLGFGFALTGVGGMVGLNRRVNTDLLRERLASGAAGNVLFCDDPVRNAPTLLGDLQAFFPQPGGFIVGPTLQISWLSPIVRLDVALVIELPGPSKIVILGSLKVLIGADETQALLYLRMDFLGVLDFQQRLVSVDAFLVNSHALGIFRLTGGMAFRLSYGDNPYVLLTIGGFHPRFDPGPLNLPVIPRVGASLDVCVVAHIYLRLELYVAFTPNTLQLGAHVEAGLEFGPISAHGYLQFDALIQFRPFAFDVAFAAGFSIDVFDLSLANVTVRGSITGPGPVVVHAQASVRRLFIKVSGSATFQLGADDADNPRPIPSIVTALEPELSRPENLRASGDDPDVVLAAATGAGLLVSPRGGLIWEQKRAPLQTLVDRFEGAPLDGQHQLVLQIPPGWNPSDETDWFSPGSFTALDLGSSQTLNNATFQELRSGVRLGVGADVTAPTTVTYKPVIDLIKRPTGIKVPGLQVGAYLTEPLSAALAQRNTTPPVTPGAAKVSVVAETHDVIGTDGQAVHAGETPFQAFQLSRQQPGTVATPSADVMVNL